MSALRTWVRCLLVSIFILIAAPHAIAERSATEHQTTEIAPNNSLQEREPAGNPLLGALVIVGIVGFLILVAWIFSRIGESNNRHSDSILN